MQEDVLRDVVVPEWMFKYVPKPKYNVPVVTYHDETYTVNYPDGVSQNFSNIEDFLKVFATEQTPLFDESLLSKDKDGVYCYINHKKFYFPNDMTIFKKFSTDILTSYSTLYYYVLCTLFPYSKALESEERYKKNPNDFITAYEFISHHPMFWTLEERYKNKGYGYYEWKINGIKKIEYNFYGDGSSVRCCMETGSWLSEGYEYGCHDMDLDVYEPTYEKAIIALAKNIDKNYTIDGKKKD